MFTKTDSLMPKVSVMMCVHNAEEYIKDCLDSIFCQSFGDFELVVVDDGSTDSTMEQVKLCSDNRIRIIQKELLLSGKTQKSIKILPEAP